MGVAGSDITPLSREFFIGWILGLVCLAVFTFCPNVNKSNGDVSGWVWWLTEYASAEGSMLTVTGDPPEGLRHSRISDEELEQLGERERNAGWWVLWHPHHLLYLPVTAFLYRIIAWFVPVFGAITFLQYWNAVASAGTIMLLYFLLIRIVPRSVFILPWCIFLASSVTFFRYATDGAQYPTPIFFMMIACGGLWGFAQKGDPKILLRASFWIALAILFHQLVSIIVPFILISVYFIIRNMRKLKVEFSWGWFWLAGGISLGLPVLVYVLIAWFALGPTGEFNIPGLLKYATLFAHQPEYWTDSIRQGILDNLLTFIGFYFGIDVTRELFLRGIWFTALTIILPAFWFTGIYLMREMEAYQRWWSSLCLLWVFPLLVFLSFWNPGHDFYHLFLTIPLSCIAVVGAETSRSPDRRRLKDVLLFWAWCVIAIYINLPRSLAGCEW